jgi:hypothetical protein
MHRHPPRPTGGKCAFVPRVETLEDRTAPAANFLVVNGTLIISGPTTPFSPGENITILDNGSTGLNNVTAFGNGAPFRPNAVISAVKVMLPGRGKQTVNYDLIGDLSGTRSLSVATSGFGSRVNVDLRANLLANSSWSGSVSTGGRASTVTLNQVGQLVGGSNMAFAAAVGPGGSTLRASTGGVISQGASMGITLDGGSGADNIFYTFNGQSNGSQKLNVDAGAGNDRVFADYELNDQSTGTILPSLIEGGTGNDSLAFIIHNRGTGFTADQVIDGGPGRNKCFRTAQVVSMNCVIDNVVP